MTSVVEASAKKRGASNTLTKTLTLAAVGAIVGAALTIGISYPTLKDKWYTSPAAAPAPAAKLKCANAQTQSLRDVSPSYSSGLKTPTSVIHHDSVSSLKHVNTHYHLGAEHKSTGQYDKLHTTSRELLAGTATDYGFYCDDVPAVSSLTATQKSEYNWEYCTDTKVGKTYEIHSVYSSGGTAMGDGLGGAFAVQNNPTVVVRGQVFHIVNDNAYDLPSGSSLMNGILTSFPGTTGSAATLTTGEVTLYSGSTTGRSYNNVDSCSPYQITWQVDQKCRLISAKSFDAMCKKMKEDYGMSADTHPHGSRDLVSNALSSNVQRTLTAF